MAGVHRLDERRWPKSTSDAVAFGTNPGLWICLAPVRLARLNGLMERVAAIYDIHGNLPALEAVLEEVRAAGVELVVVGGDVLPGPMPRETLDCLFDLDLPIQFIRGNGDRIVLEEHAGKVAAGLPEAIRATVRWNAEQLTHADVRRISAWPETLRVDTVTGSRLSGP